MEEFYDHSEYPVATCYVGMTRNTTDVPSSLNASFVGDTRPSHSGPDKACHPFMKQTDPYFNGQTSGKVVLQAGRNERALRYPEGGFGLRNGSCEPLCSPSKSRNLGSTDDEKKYFSWMIEARTHSQDHHQSKWLLLLYEESGLSTEVLNFFFISHRFGVSLCYCIGSPYQLGMKISAFFSLHSTKYLFNFHDVIRICYWEFYLLLCDTFKEPLFPTFPSHYIFDTV